MKKRRNRWNYFGLLAIVLAISVASLIGYSYSKYTKTIDNGTITGKVANFGASLSRTGNLFFDSYATDDATYSGTIINSVVSSVAGVKKLAPGTNNGTGLVFEAEIADNEVAIALNFSFSSSDVTGWELTDGTIYHPVKFTISKSDGTNVTYYNGTSFVGTEPVDKLSVAQVGTLNERINIAPNSTATYTYTILWQWEVDSTSPQDSYYECSTAVGSYVVGDVICADTYNGLTSDLQAGFSSCGTSNDALDTLYGGAHPKPSMTITTSITATQID